MTRDEVDRLIRYHEVDRRFIDFIPVCESWLTLEQRVRELEEENARLRERMEKMRARADGYYCAGLNYFRRPEGLGWEAKVQSGEFGEKEMNAHKEGNMLLGRHFGIHEALNYILEAHDADR